MQYKLPPQRVAALRSLYGVPHGLDRRSITYYEEYYA